jgi:hypothetical protein
LVNIVGRQQFLEADLRELIPHRLNDHRIVTNVSHFALQGSH